MNFKIFASKNKLDKNYFSKPRKCKAKPLNRYILFSILAVLPLNSELWQAGNVVLLLQETFVKARQKVQSDSFWHRTKFDQNATLGTVQKTRAIKMLKLIFYYCGSLNENCSTKWRCYFFLDLSLFCNLELKLVENK